MEGLVDEKEKAVLGSVTGSSAAGETLSENALKKELENKRKEEERRCEEEEKAKQAASVADSRSKTSAAADDEDMDPTQYFENRLKHVASLRAAGVEPYPHNFPVTMSIPEYVEQYKNVGNGEHLEDVTVNLAGRIMSKGSSSSKLFFYDLHGCFAKVQVMADASKSDLNEEEFSRFHSTVKRGDIVGVKGFPGKTERGELSIFPRSFMVLSYCLRMLPKAGSVSDNANLKETGNRPIHLELMLNAEFRKFFKTTCKIISYIRRFLENRGFLQADTPMMNTIAGRAAALPFVTHHNDLNMKLFTRIRGFGRVYEIGKQFRNEGLDLTHNPELTTCELYMADADYEDLMVLTETMLSGMVEELTGGCKIKYHANGLDEDPIEIDFTPPFRRIDMIEELEKMANLNIPKDFSSDEAKKYLIDACTKYEIKCAPPETTARLLDKLVGHFLGETCTDPAFIINHPELMSPLAKWHGTKKGLTECFELFINKHELCNAYTELNDPVVLCQRFAVQLKDRQSGDDEAFCTAVESLEYGSPPRGCWGLGIDRLIMLLTDSQNIKEVLLFPATTP